MVKRKRMNRRRKPLHARRGKKKLPGHITSKQVMLYKAPNHNPFPLEYIVPLKSVFYGNFLTGGVNPVGFAGGPSNQCAVNLMSRQPFIYGFNGVNGLLSVSTALQPAGFATLCNANMYYYYQVLSATVKFAVTPLVNLDQCITTQTTSASVIAPLNCMAAIDQPWTKRQDYKVFTTPKWNIQTTPIGKYLGIDPKVYRNEQVVTHSSGVEISPISAYNATPTMNLWSVINLITENNSSLTFQLPFQCEVTQLYRFFNLNTQNIN